MKPKTLFEKMRANRSSTAAVVAMMEARRIEALRAAQRRQWDFEHELESRKLMRDRIEYLTANPLSLNTERPMSFLERLGF